VNAAILAVQMLALSDTDLKRKLVSYKAKMRREVLKSDAELQALIQK
jgi:phosphoribosylcarboxyaminoimidazole (NCAIR) mutase